MSLTKRGRAILAAATLPVLSVAVQPAAATVWWDTNGTTAGAGTTPDGTWSAAVANWGNTGGTAAPAVYGADTAVRFAAGTDAANAYTVTVVGTVNASAFGVEELPAITFNGGIINFTQAAGATAILTGVTAATPTTLVINSQISGTSGFRIARNVALGNIVTISNTANNFSGGLRVGLDNTLRLGASDVVPDGNLVTVDAGGTFALNGFNETVASITSSGTINLGGNTLTLAAPAGQTFSGVISGANGKLVKNGTGTLTLGGTANNTFSGLTTVNAGVLALSKTAAINALVGDVTVGDGSGTDTLQLVNSNQIANAADMTLNGGKFDINSQDETLATLDVDASSSIDFGAGTDSLLKFANSSGVAWAGGAILDILNWSGLPAGGGTEQLTFGTDATGLTPAQLAQIHFVDGAAPGGFYPATILPTGEVVALVPEPTTAGLMLLAGAGLAMRRRRRA